MNANQVNWRAVAYLVLASTFTILFVGLVGIVFSGLSQSGPLRPEIFLTLLLIAGVVVLISSLAIAVAVLAALGLTDRGSSFGLPEGSIRAVIALSLIIIFAMTSVYLYANMSTPRATRLDGLTLEQVATIPALQIVSIEASAQDPSLRTVMLQQQPNQAGQDFAKQILTTTATLVVAVAGFYFGAKSVIAAKAGAETRTLRILSPSDPYSVPGGLKSVAIKLEAQPNGLAIIGKVDGKPDASLAMLSHNEFEYAVPVPLPQKKVELSFFLAVDPTVNETLTLVF